MDAFDVVVLGGGIGGYTAAAKLAQSGLRIALVEQDKVGGVCLHRGCVPTKLFLEAAEALSLIRRSAKFGIEVENIRLDYASLARRKDEIVAGLHKNVRNVLRKHRVDTIEGRARLLSPTRIGVDGRTVETKHVVLATGSRPRALSGLPIDGERVLTSDHALNLPEVPRSVIIIGGGVIGLEFSSLYIDMGCEVTLIELMPHLLPGEDRDLGDGIGRLLAQRGATVMTGAKVLPDRTRFYDDRVEMVVEHVGQEETVQGEKVLVAVGRQGNVEDIGLEDTRVRVEDDFVAVDGRMRTDEPNVYAIGDVVGEPLLAHAAALEAMVAAEAIAGGEPEAIDYARVPRVVYSRPQIAVVGLTEAEASAGGHKVKATRFSLRYNAMAVIKDETAGFVKLVSDADSGDLLGVHILGANAAELIAPAALARWLDVSTWELATSIYPHPSLSEALGEAAQMSAGMSIYL